MDTGAYSDPAKVGRGLWLAMHEFALIAHDDSTKESFVRWVTTIAQNFRCKKCQPHFLKFIETHPFKNYWSIKHTDGREIGFFKWSWELHNQVNKFLKYYEPTLEEALAFYSKPETSACYSCGSHPEEKAILTPIKKPNPIEPHENITKITDTKPVPAILTDYIRSHTGNSAPFRLIETHK